jgi:hypothetical protein
MEEKNFLLKNLLDVNYRISTILYTPNLFNLLKMAVTEFL